MTLSELRAAVTFVQPQMVGRVRMDRLKRIGFEKGLTDTCGNLLRGRRPLCGITAADPHAAEHQYCEQDFVYMAQPSLGILDVNNLTALSSSVISAYVEHNVRAHDL